MLGQLSLWNQGGLALLTSVCVSVSLLLVPGLACSQCVGRVLSEEGDDVAAGGSQRGVQRGRDAELNHRSACDTGRREGGACRAAPARGKGLGSHSEMTGQNEGLRWEDAGAGPMISVRSWWCLPARAR